MRGFFVLSLLLLLFLLGTPAQPLAEGIVFFNGDSPMDDLNLKDDMFTSLPNLRDSQDPTVSQDNNQMDISTWSGDDFGLDATNAGSQVIPLDISDFSVPVHNTLESVCILDSVGPGIKARQNIIPDWLTLPNWLSPPSEEESKPGPDICIPPRIEEPRCKPGEQTLCCTGKSKWIDDSMVLVVNGCARCTSPAISHTSLHQNSFLIPTWLIPCVLKRYGYFGLQL